MWFLIKGADGKDRWHRVRVHQNLSVALHKKYCRAHGVPILAIARLKPRPQTEPYDDVRD